MRIGLALVAVLACAGRAEAQFDHRLLAQSGVGEGCNETTEELAVDLLDKACESGVVGLDPNSFSNTASVNSATGHLAVTSVLSVDEPPASFSPDAIDTIALLQERLSRTAPGPIRATLQVSSGLDVGGAVVDYEVSLRLTNSCTAFFSQSVGNGFVNPPSDSASCPGGSASADGNTLTVTLESNVTTIDLLAQLRSEWLFFFELGGQYQIDADLRVEALEGASFTAPSPSFLMQVPEPAASLAASAALAALGALARRRHRR